jgi:hypothetical protein
MTNILSIPLLDGANTSFMISNNAAWTDSIYFGAPGYGPPFVINGCVTTIGTNIITVPVAISAANINVGMQVSGSPGLPSASYVGAITSVNTFAIVDSSGNALTATATSAEVSVTFNPPPLDLSGIGFVSNLRIAAGSTQVFLVAQTGNGTMTIGGALGTLAWNVPRKIMQSVPAGGYVMDVLAADTTTVINLFPKAPASVIVTAGVADINTLTGITHP